MVQQRNSTDPSTIQVANSKNSILYDSQNHCKKCTLTMRPFQLPLIQAKAPKFFLAVLVICGCLCQGLCKGHLAIWLSSMHTCLTIAWQSKTGKAHLLRHPQSKNSVVAAVGRHRPTFPRIYQGNVSKEVAIKSLLFRSIQLRWVRAMNTRYEHPCDNRNALSSNI